MENEEMTARVTINDDVKKAIVELETRQGTLSSQVVVDEARDISSPLHPFFQWDDSIAAEAYRIQQAESLIRRVKIETVVSDTTITSVRYVSMRGSDVADDEQEEKAPSRNYVSIPMMDANATACVMKDEIKRILGNVTRTLLIAKTKDNKAAKYVRDNLGPVETTLKAILTKVEAFI